jgi:hypothetical protein
MGTPSSESAVAPSGEHAAPGCTPGFDGGAPVVTGEVGGVTVVAVGAGSVAGGAVGSGIARGDVVATVDVVAGVSVVGVDDVSAVPAGAVVVDSPVAAVCGSPRPPSVIAAAPMTPTAMATTAVRTAMRAHRGHPQVSTRVVGR